MTLPAVKHYIWSQTRRGWLMARVLVVDREPMVRSVLTQWVQSWGYEAAGVAGAEEALEHMRTTPADIVIADANMPEHDTVWLLDQLRARFPHTIVITESGADDLETALRTRLHGAFDHIPKPLAHETVQQALERARTSIQPPAEQVPHVQPRPDGAKSNGES